MENQLVSVIMPCHNSIETVEQAVDSVLRQNYENLELIIIDDASSEPTRLCLKRIQACDKRVKVIRNGTRTGVANARNKGIRDARGRYICFLDSDDFLLPNSIYRRVQFLSSYKSSVVYGSYYRMFYNGKCSIVVPPKHITFSGLLKSNVIGNLTGMYDSHKLGKELQLKVRHEDYVMWCNLVLKAGSAAAVDGEPLAVYRVSGASLSGNKIKSFIWHWLALRDGLRQSAILSVYYQLCYVYRSVLIRWNDRLRIAFPGGAK